MKDPIHKYFRINTIQWNTYPHGNEIASLKSLASDLFFDGVVLKGYGQRNKEARQILSQSHLSVFYGAQIHLLLEGLNPNAICEEERRRAERKLLEKIDEAVYLHASSISFLAGKWEKSTQEQAYSQLLTTTRRICDYAAEKGLLVELEVFDYDMDKAALIGPATYAARFAADLCTTHSNFGVLVDLSHFPTTYETSKFVLQILRPYITHFHFGNAVVTLGCDGYGDQHPRMGFPNSANDTAQLLDYLEVLQEEGFFHAGAPYPLTMEVIPRPGEDEDLVLANTKRVLTRAWALLNDLPAYD